VNHRKRHGFFTHREELAEVKEFPLAALGQVKQRNTLRRPDLKEDRLGPRRMKPSATERVKKKPKGYTKGTFHPQTGPPATASVKAG
jgi:hypothetical protein